MRLRSALVTHAWPSLLTLLTCCGRVAQPPDADEPTSTGGVGGSGGAFAGSGGALATGGVASGGGYGGEAVAQWESFLLMAGSPGVFSRDNLRESCRAETDGTVVGCSEYYDAEAEIWCDHLVIEPPRIIRSSDPCPRAGFLGVCLIEADLRVQYYYAKPTGSFTLAEDCELKEGWFYEP